MPEIKVKCSCGKIQGVTENVNSNSGTRVVCCCDDCQSFARYLDQEQNTLNEYGGTDIFQMPISHLKITEGSEYIACIRLKPKGLYRWYAKCCNTPIGNSLGAGGPFIGVIHNFMDNAMTRDEDLGKIRGYGLTKFAKKEVPLDQQSSIFRLILISVSKFMIWKLKGLNRPSAFFNENGDPIAEPKVLRE